jgi:hypothetical protein
MKTPHVIPSSIAYIVVEVCVIVLLLSPLPGYATQQGPFADLSGDWSGGGTVTLSSGSNEKIRCRATYDSQAASNNLKLALRCASEIYNVDFRGTAVNSGGNMTGNWFESTNQAAGQFFGSIKGNRIDAKELNGRLSQHFLT